MNSRAEDRARRPALRRWRTIPALLPAYVLLSNFVPYVCPWKPAIHAYLYEGSCGDYSNIEIPEKGRGFDMVSQQFQLHGAAHPGATLVLYRNARRSPSEFYEWWDYITHPRWDLPYRPRDLRPRTER